MGNMTESNNMKTNKSQPDHTGTKSKWEFIVCANVLLYFSVYSYSHTVSMAESNEIIVIICVVVQKKLNKYIYSRLPTSHFILNISCKSEDHLTCVLYIVIQSDLHSVSSLQHTV